jgi:hypothetical protein
MGIDGYPMRKKIFTLSSIKRVGAVLGGYPTFGWFDYDYVSTARQQVAAVPGMGSVSHAIPWRGRNLSHRFRDTDTSRVRHHRERGVEYSVSDGTGFGKAWTFPESDCRGDIHRCRQSGFVHRLTLLGR